MEEEHILEQSLVSSNGSDEILENGDNAVENQQAEKEPEGPVEGTMETEDIQAIPGREQYDENLEDLNNKLKVALKEIITKDNLVKQHAKVAEDAISGWEKAETEAGLLKQQLESAMQQKSGLEERVAHLDGALKECVKQMRNGREEQEQKQEEMAKKSEEWDALRSELEARISKAESQLLSVTSESAAKTESYEQRITSLTDAKHQADLEVKKVSTKIETLEKENMNLKHDVRVLKKDLVALNNESKKASEVAKQQVADSARKVSRLEAECQKLKSQLRKRSSASATSQVREVDLDRRKSLGRLTNSPRAFSVESVDDCSEMSTRDRDIEEKSFAQEEETRLLKEELAKRNKELQAARIMCGRTASKLSNVQEQLETIYGAQDVSGSTVAGLNVHIETLRAFGNNQQYSLPSPGSRNDDESDAWASALVAELAQFKKEEKKPDKLLDTTSFELMDDFLEMEKLTSNLPQENGRPWEAGGANARKGHDLHAANELIMALSKKVAILENELHSSKAANGYKTQTDEVFSCVNGGSENHENKSQDTDSPGMAKLTSVLLKIVRSVEILAHDAGLEAKAGTDQLNGTHSDSDSNTDCSTAETAISPGLKWADANVNASFEKLCSAASVLLQRKAEFSSFAEEVASTLDMIVGLQRQQSALIAKYEADIQRLKGDNSLLESELAGIKASTGESGSSLAVAKQTIEQLTKELSGYQENVTSLRAEKLALEDALKTHSVKTAPTETSEISSGLEADDETLKLQKQEMEEEIQQLTCRIAALENDVQVAEERAQSTVRGISATFEEDLSRAESARVTAEKSVQAMKDVLAELGSEKEKLDESAKFQLERIHELEDQLRQGKLEKLAAQRDIDAVNQDIQKLMADFVQLQHEKQNFEDALLAAKQQVQEECNRSSMHLDTIARLEQDLRESSQRIGENRKSVDETRLELDRYMQREEALHKALSEKEAKEIELELCLEKLKEDSASSKEKLEKKLLATNELLNIEEGMVTALKEEVRRLEVENLRLEENLKAQEASFISLQDEFYQLRVEKEDMEQSLALADQDVQELRGSVANLDEECRRLKAENTDIQNGFQKDVQRVQGEADRSDKELKVLSTENEKLCGELGATKKIVEEMKAECVEMETELSILKSANGDAEQKLNGAVSENKRLEAECRRLENEKADLEHVLAATNEIVQGVKTECSRLSDVEEDLKFLKVEKDELERRSEAAEEKLKSVNEDLKTLEAKKAELEHDLALSQVTWKSQVFEAEELVASLRAELALSAKAKQLAEDQLGESFSAKADLQYQVKAAMHEASQLEERANTLEEELVTERRKSQTIAAELDNLRQELSRRKENGDESTTSTVVTERNEDKALQNHDLAAKLDECHRAILSLGEQLQTLSASKDSPSRNSPTEPATSEESINTVKPKDEPEDAVSAKLDQSEAQQAVTSQEVGVPESGESTEGKVFVPSLPLEGRPRSKSMSPAKSKASKSVGSKEDLTKSLDMGSGSPLEKPSSSSAFSRFFRSKGSSHHHS